MKPKYQTILLKISGEALKGDQDQEIYTEAALTRVARQIIQLTEHHLKVGIVVGGGNIWRGQLGAEIKMPTMEADYMGMLATIMNALALESALYRLGFTKVKIYSSLEVRTITEDYNYRQARDYLGQGYVLLFAGGTGYSNFTTDTAAVLRAAEINADALFMAKNGVAGVYDRDPKRHNKAQLLKHLTHSEVVQRDLKVMDLTAITLAKANRLKIRVFDLQKPDNIIKVITDDNIGTTIE